MNNKENLKVVVLCWFGVFIALLLIVFNTIFFQMLKHSFYNKISNSLSIISNQVKDEFVPVYGSNKIVTIPQKLEYPVAPVMISVFGIKNMKVIAQTTMFLDIDLNSYLLSKDNFFIGKSKKYGKIGIYILRLVSPIKGYIVVATPLHKVDEKLQDILIKMLILNPILLLLVMLGVNMVLNRVLNPIKNITKVANEIGVGDLDRTIPLPMQNDEIKELVKSFNAMVMRLRNGVEMMERFNSDVSHELKTPLTVLKGEVELALRKDRDTTYYKETLKIVLKEVNYLIDMVEEMLFFTKVENEISKKSMVKIDEILLNVVSKLSIKAKEKNIKLNIDNLDMCDMETNPVLLQTLFINIIDNAIKYSFNDKKIDISLKCKDDCLEFIVKDEGIGIKESEIDKLTQRFYRTEKSRNRNIKGFGLGLSIVQKLLEILGGNIKFISTENKGTEVKIVIKK